VTGLAGDGGAATWSAAMAAAQLQASVPAAGRGRKRGRAASVEYDTHAERRHAKAMRKAEEMVAALPNAVVLRAVAGDGAGASGQMPPVEVQAQQQSRRDHLGSRTQLWSDTEDEQTRSKHDQIRTPTTRSGF